MDTGSIISVPAPLDKYGTRARPHIRAGISIRVIHGYLDTHGYSRVPMDIFLIFFCTKKNAFFNYLHASTFKDPYINHNAYDSYIISTNF